MKMLSDCARAETPNSTKAANFSQKKKKRNKMNEAHSMMIERFETYAVSRWNALRALISDYVGSEKKTYGGVDK